MALVLLSEIPEMLEAMVDGSRKAIGFNRPTHALSRYLLPPMAYSLVPPNLAALAQESPEATVLVACDASFRQGAWEKIAAYGDFPVINYFTPDYLYPFLPSLRQLPLDYARHSKRSTGRRGIILRGALAEESCFQALQKIAADHPEDYIIVSTWDHITPAEQARLAALCDCLVLNKMPAFAGIQNRNLQATCIRSGVKAALQAGVEKMFVARLDCLFTNPAMLEGFDALLHAFPSTVAQASGQKGRLIVPDFGTRYYVPYHISDMFTYGWAEDVARYWLAVADDPRDVPDDTGARLAPVSIRKVSALNLIIETFFATAFMQAIHRPIAWTLPDSLAFTRDFFIPVDSTQAGMFWFKKFWFNRTLYTRPLSRFVTHQRWLELLAAQNLDACADLDIEKITWGEYRAAY